MKNHDLKYAVKKYFGGDIVSVERLTGGYTFNTRLVTLAGGEKIVFRSSPDFYTGGGRKIIAEDIFRREKFFYENINGALGKICPEVYVIDGSLEFFGEPFQISEYMAGTRLDLCIGALSEPERRRVYFRFGEIAAGVNSVLIGEDHNYIKERGEWGAFFSARLRERLAPLIKNKLVNGDEIEKLTAGCSRAIGDKNFLSFLHLDMRFINMIYDGGKIYLIDAENCEFGDPLFELSVIELNGLMTEDFLTGYEGVSGETPDTSGEAFLYYKLERLALIANVFINEVGSEKDGERFKKEFMRVKERLM